jgi:alanine racemase
VTPEGWRPTVAEIDLGAIRENVVNLAAVLRPGARVLAVVKANAYGHGDVAVARACLEAGAGSLGVALVEEGVRLREAGIDAPVLLLVEHPPDASDAIVGSALTPSVSSRASIDAIGAASSRAGQRTPIHVVVDTGMHREGVPFDQAAELVVYADARPDVRVEGLWSHLAVADEKGNDFTALQVRRFTDVCAAVEHAGIDVPLRHLANSAGALACPDAHFDMVRLGIAVYGLHPADHLRARCELRPAMRLRSAVSTVRRVRAGEGISYGHRYAPAADATIASIPVGYGDGFTRLYTGRSEVLIGGRRRAVAGTVTMDQIMADCGDDDVAPGDEVVLIGSQGAETLTADDLAAAVGTINYEVVCAIGARVPRVYVG